jgi:CheY-like chemotaxis protein
MIDAKKVTVLVVDDEPLVRMDLADMLTLAGYQTREACCASEGIEILEHDPEIKVVFTDIQMPGSMDGLALARYVREHWPVAVIVVSSGNRSPTPSEMPDGADFLAKPVGALELEGVLKRVQGKLSAL